MNKELNSKENTLLNVFSNEIKSHIIEFCKNISSLTDADVFILLARKAACFIDVLTELNLVHLKGIVVSERVLDMNTEWLRKKRVVIIDDTIISGTSIRKTIQKLENIGVENIRVKVFCVNDYWYVPELLQKDKKNSYLEKPYLRLKHTATLKFCQNIVQLLSIFPRPYATDFPIYDSVRIKESDFQQLLFSKEWKVVDTTSDLQFRQNISTISLNPKRAVIDEFYKSIGINLKEFSFMKIRIYGYKFDSLVREEHTPFGKKMTRAFYLCRVLPLIIFNPVSIKFIDNLIIKICESENCCYDSLMHELTENVSKLRFVQYYFSHRFMMFFVEKSNQTFNSTISIKSPYKSLNNLFNVEVIELITKFKFNGLLESSEELIQDSFLVQNIESSKENECINPYFLKNKLLNVFLDYYHQDELPARRLVKKEGLKAFNDFSCRKKIDRLERGVSFLDLKNEISHSVNNRTDSNLIISSFLDNTIDSGIVVPVSIEDNGYLYRGYRHGEEVIWGKNNDKLLSLFFDSFLQQTKLKTIPKFWFEKLTVLFLKMGLQAGILQEYNYNSPPNLNMDIIGVRSYLYGQVTVSYRIKPKTQTNFNPILDFETKCFWNTNRLTEIGVLSIEDEQYKLDTDRLFLHKKTNNEDKLENEPEDLDESFSDEAEEIGELLAECYNSKILKQEGLVQLTSCANIEDCISSIAAEIYIFNQKIKFTLDNIFSALSDNSISVDFLNKLRGKKNHSWISINSGQKKYTDFKAKEGINLINSISVYLGERNKSQRRSWKRFWNQSIEYSNEESPALYDLNDKIGIEILEIFIISSYQHILIYKILEDKGQIQILLDELNDRIDSNSRKIEIIKNKTKQLAIDSSTNKQTEIDYVNAELIKDLTDAKKKLSLDNLSTKNRKEYWETYLQLNTDKIRVLYKEYKGSFSRNDIVNNIILNLDNLHNNNIGRIKEEVLYMTTILETYIESTENILKEFTGLVPQWGKINKNIDYSSIIHINSNDKNAETRENIKLIVKKVLADFEHTEFKTNNVQEKSVVLLRPSFNSDYPGYYIGLKGQFKIDRLIKLSSLFLDNLIEIESNFSVNVYPNLSLENSIKVFYNPATKIFDNVVYDFTDFFSQCEKQIINLPSGLYIYCDGKNDIDYYYLKIKSNLKKQVLSKNLYNSTSQSTDIETIYHYQLTENRKMTNKTIGVITALPKEFAAMRLMLDDIYKPEVNGEDPNDYVIGYINSKYHGKRTKVVLSTLKEMGNNLSASTVTNMLRSFNEIDEVLMVGIAGGVPNPEKVEDHVRLGDIVYSDKVLHYQNIKELDDNITIRSNLAKPSALFISKTNLLEADRLVGERPWEGYIKKYSLLMEKSTRPNNESDILKISGEIIEHPKDENRRNGHPRIFKGAIGSAHSLLKSETKRNYLRDNFTVKAIEMEAAGIADGTWEFNKGYFVIRSIVDYCNNDKSDLWQNYAAVVAASYAKCLIELIE